MANYIASYNAETLSDSLKNFFSAYIDDDKIVEIRKEMRKLSKELEEKGSDLSVLLSKRYNAKLTLLDKDPVISYQHGTSVNFDCVTGQILDNYNSDNYEIYTVTRKTGEVYMLIGYSYEMAAVVVRLYKYYINTSNTAIRLVQQHEAIIPVFDISKTIQMGNDNVVQNVDTYTARSILSNINASEFIQNFYGINNFTCSFNLAQLYKYTTSNKSTEIILRTVDDHTTRNKLLEMSSDVAVPIHTLIGMTKPEYKRALAENTLGEYLDLKTLLENTTISGKAKENIQKLNYSTSDWLDFILHTKAWVDDLDFYGIGHLTNLSVQLAGAYLGCGEYPFYLTANNIFADYYKFGKWANYVIEECVNQGYTRLHNFMCDLLDYIKLCRELNCKPTLYSSYLKQTHDIVARNHQLKVSEEQELTFKERYKDIKDIALSNGFSVIKPNCPNDLQREGDNLNHCVASYIKRVLDDACRIMFLRKTEVLTESLVTLEIAGEAIVQARGQHNRSITKDEREALIEYAQKNKLKVKV